MGVFVTEGLAPCFENLPIARQGLVEPALVLAEEITARVADGQGAARCQGIWRNAPKVPRHNESCTVTGSANRTISQSLLDLGQQLLGLLMQCGVTSCTLEGSSRSFFFAGVFA